MHHSGSTAILIQAEAFSETCALFRGPKDQFYLESASDLPKSGCKVGYKKALLQHSTQEECQRAAQKLGLTFDTTRDGDYHPGCFRILGDEQKLFWGTGSASEPHRTQQYLCTKKEGWEEDSLTEIEEQRAMNLQTLDPTKAALDAEKIVCETKSCYHRWQNGKCEKIRQEN